jgi:hypothetical protein
LQLFFLSPLFGTEGRGRRQLYSKEVRRLLLPKRSPTLISSLPSLHFLRLKQLPSIQQHQSASLLPPTPPPEASTSLAVSLFFPTSHSSHDFASLFLPSTSSVDLSLPHRDHPTRQHGAPRASSFQRLHGFPRRSRRLRILLPRSREVSRVWRRLPCVCLTSS